MTDEKDKPKLVAIDTKRKEKEEEHIDNRNFTLINHIKDIANALEADDIQNLITISTDGEGRINIYFSGDHSNNYELYYYMQRALPAIYGDTFIEDYEDLE